jgi:hypothetical protein
LAENPALQARGPPPSCGRFMDKFWSIFAMPIGLFICFGPALLVWLRMELTAKDEDDQ